MSKRVVHPANSPVITTATDTEPHPPTVSTKTLPESYVIHVPKDQVLRVPPPENARKYKKYTQRAKRRKSCCRCFCWTISILVLLIFLLAITAGILYFTFRPKTPKYSVDSISVDGFNLSSNTVSPEFNVTVSAINPNKKIKLDYQNGGTVVVSYSGLELSKGVWPVFYQGSRNITVFKIFLTGSPVILSETLKQKLMKEQESKIIPLVVNVNVPVKLKFGSVKTWKFIVKARNYVSVDELTINTRIVYSRSKGVFGFLWNIVF